MSHLNAAQIELLRSTLQDRRRALLREIAEHQHGKQRVEALIEEFRETGKDWDLAPVFRDIEHAENERDRGELAAIQTALERIDDGSIGTCVDCSEEIPFARLHAQPYAARCIDCQELVEQRSGTAPPASI